MIKLSHKHQFLLCFFLVTFCFFSYSSFAKSINYQQLSNNNKSNLKTEIIREKSFQKILNGASLGSEFRILVKLSKQTYLRTLKNYGKDIHEFNVYPGIAITLSKAEIMNQIQNNVFTEIWRNSEITTLSNDQQVESLNLTQNTLDFNEKVETSDLWNKGIYGSDITVAILDTGIDLDNPALNRTMENEVRIIGAWNFVQHTFDVDDDNGHGTEIAGIIGSSGLHGYMQGVAPNCKFLIGKILSNTASGTVENLIQGIDWAIENEADVINLSVGKPVNDKMSPEVEAVNNAVKQGIIVCVGVGNSRKTIEFGYNDFYTVLSPGIATQAITVGATDNNNILYEHSSAGPVAVNYNSTTSRTMFDTISEDDSWLKPDVLAPGVKLNTTSYNGKKTTIVTGTSYATAVVSGVCSLLLQVYYEAHPSMIKNAILETSQSLNLNLITPLDESMSYSVSAQYQGAGLVNVSSALEYLLNPSTITFQPSRIPYTQYYYFLNSEKILTFQLYINKKIDDLSIEIANNIVDLVTISNLPTSFNIGQYDLKMKLTTEDAYQTRYRSYISVIADGEEFRYNIEFHVISAKGRILLDCGVTGDEKYYSLFGSLKDIIELSRAAGLIPEIQTKDGLLEPISTKNLNDYEVISLINYNNSIYQTSSDEDLSALSDYLLPDGNFYGGTLLLLPSATSDLNSINTLLSPVNISYEMLLENSIIFDLSGSSDILSTHPNQINELFIPSPFNISTENELYLSLNNSFVYADFRLDNGSLLIAANNIDMFLNTPYLYSSETSEYDELFLSSGFGSNNEMLGNLLYASSVRSLLFDYEINKIEVKYDDPIQIEINVYNQYKTIKN
ncbi:MAG: S8 family serine peptidase, partial [Candidatus Heimdallarchaeota archaeon]|nr:S8 family serine peptidase [Candidatus Heimdallarchaeota archaeon]MCK4954884.1 S8 family serine peptidase [Candidatus Heimdallarchaeota archaeon]